MKTTKYKRSGNSLLKYMEDKNVFVHVYVNLRCWTLKSLIKAYEEKLINNWIGKSGYFCLPIAKVLAEHFKDASTS